MFRAISNGLDWVYRIAGYLAGAFLVAFCALVIYRILARLFDLYDAGAGDIAGYGMATSTFLALAYAFRTHGHIRVQLVVQQFTGRARQGLEIVCLTVMTVVSVFIAWYMTRLAYDSYDFGERSEGADAWLVWIPQAPVAAGAWLLALAVVHTLLQAVFDYEAVDPSTQEGPSEI